MNIEINEQLAQKVKNIVSHGLSKGLGNPILGQMCVEAAVNYACGLPHGDSPTCVGSAVRAFKININDANWSSTDARAKGMLKIAIAQLGSNTIDQKEFNKILAFKTITILLSDFLQSQGFEKEAINCKNAKDLNKANNAATYATYADAAIADAADAAAVVDKSDKYLLMACDICLQALLELKSPGTQFLYLCD